MTAAFSAAAFSSTNAPICVSFKWGITDNMGNLSPGSNRTDVATIATEHAAGDVGGRNARNKRRQCTEFSRCPIAAHRHTRGRPGSRLFYRDSLFLGSRGVGEAHAFRIDASRYQYIHGDAVSCNVSGQGF